MLKNLVKQKACLEHLETRDNDQRTPLLVASFRSSAEVCQLLQSVGADISVEDKRANKPAELAGRVGRRKSKELFDLGLGLGLGLGLANPSPNPNPAPNP